MPKTLFLVRHAKSSWADPGQPDFDRPLNHRGQRDAPEMGSRIKTGGLLPQVILCSTARRARQTLIGLDLNVEHIHFEERIYEATTETLRRIVQSLDNACHSAMIIGHNPGLSWLIASLTGGDRVANMPTCSIARIGLETDDWRDAGTAPAELENIDYPDRT